MTQDELQDNLGGAIADLDAQVSFLRKRLETRRQTPPTFETTSAAIRKRDNCSRTAALVKARLCKS